jgi:oligopeptidase B
LRATRSNDAPIVLRTTMEAGHGGRSGRFDRLREVAQEYAFFLHLAGRAE